jgi:hypothetical protein
VSRCHAADPPRDEARPLAGSGQAKLLGLLP